MLIKDTITIDDLVYYFLTNIKHIKCNTYCFLIQLIPYMYIIFNKLVISDESLPLKSSVNFI